jgi:hypothetical protein
MIDALLFGIRDAIRAQPFGYGSESLCDIQDDGHPPVSCGNIYVAIHEGTSQSKARRNLDEYFAFAVTLTMRVSVPLDRIGNALLASKLARTATKGQPSFNARMEQLRAFLHMNWSMTVVPGQTPPSANDNIAAWTPSGSVYGFIEPAGYTGRDKPQLVGGEWFGAAPDASDIGIICEMRFDGARRLQPQTLAVGPYG